ncbi:MAG: hypothetical protein ACRDA4_05035 [Filifactoraceae bacterium]
MYYILVIFLIGTIFLYLAKILNKFRVMKLKSRYLFITIIDLVWLIIFPFLVKFNINFENALVLVIFMGMINYVASKIYISLNTKKQGKNVLLNIYEK